MHACAHEKSERKHACMTKSCSYIYNTHTRNHAQKRAQTCMHAHTKSCSKASANMHACTHEMMLKSEREHACMHTRNYAQKCANEVMPAQRPLSFLAHSCYFLCAVGKRSNRETQIPDESLSLCPCCLDPVTGIASCACNIPWHCTRHSLPMTGMSICQCAGTGCATFPLVPCA